YHHQTPGFPDLIYRYTCNPDGSPVLVSDGADYFGGLPDSKDLSPWMMWRRGRRTFENDALPTAKEVCERLKAAREERETGQARAKAALEQDSAHELERLVTAGEELDTGPVPPAEVKTEEGIAFSGVKSDPTLKCSGLAELKQYAYDVSAE